jgi:drug/metabolite transporter (DMT)-like permease/ABC-type amino acid transport substrate-binding protein
VPKSPLGVKSKAVFLTILAGVLWGTSFPIIKIGLTTIDPFAFLFWRFLVSTFALIFVLFLVRKLEFKVTNKKLLVFLGVANGAGYLLQYVGMPYTTAAKAALFINLSAIWVALLSPKLLGENFSAKKKMGILLGLIGIVFVSTNLNFSTLRNGQLVGDLSLVFSGIFWALFMIYNKSFVMKSTSGTLQSMTWVLIITLFSILPFTVLSGYGFFIFSGWAWAAIIYTAIVCWVLPYYLWLEGLKYLSASTSTILLLSEIVVAVILSIVFLNEPVTVFSTIGAFLIVIAITLVSVQDKKDFQNYRLPLSSLMLKLKYIKHRHRAWGELKMSKILTVALVIIMLVVGFVVGLVSSPFLIAQNSSTTDTVWENIQTTGVIKVGTDPTWPPYQLRDETTGQIVGFEVDLANACAEKLGLTIQWNDVGFDNIILSVQQGQLDMGVSGFSVTPERLDQVSFTLPHSTTEGQVVMLESTMTAKGITSVHSLEELKTLGITVGVQSGNVEQIELQNAGVDIRTWSDSASPFQDMVSANPSVQGVYAETPITTSWIAQFHTEGKTVDVIYNHPYYPVAFLTAKGSTTLLDKMNGALAELIYDGTVDQLKSDWHA